MKVDYPFNAQLIDLKKFQNQYISVYYNNWQISFQDKNIYVSWCSF